MINIDLHHNNDRKHVDRYYTDELIAFNDNLFVSVCTTFQYFLFHNQASGND